MKCVDGVMMNMTGWDALHWLFRHCLVWATFKRSCEQHQIWANI